MLMTGALARRHRPEVLLRTYGVVFLLVLALLVALTSRSTSKAFTAVVRVTLRDRPRRQPAAPPADVKLRGMIVGEVRAVRTDGATAHASSSRWTPTHVGLIPANVEARLLPKTLFGEKYVDLVLPGRPVAAAARRGRRDRAGPLEHGDRARDASSTTCCRCCARSSRRSSTPRSTRSPPRWRAAASSSARTSSWSTATSPSSTRSCRRSRRTSRGWPTCPNLRRRRAGPARGAAQLSVTDQHDRRASARRYAGFLAGTAGLRTTTRGSSTENEDRIIQLGGVGRPTLGCSRGTRRSTPACSQGLTAVHD